MRFTYEMILYLLITTLMGVYLILSNADGKNTAYIEVAATEAMLKCPPYGYITPEIQANIKSFLQETRGMDPSLVTIEGTTTVSQRKEIGSADETITFRIRYPKLRYIFFGGVVQEEYKAKRTIKTEYKAGG